jgi:hypothetical protein
MPHAPDVHGHRHIRHRTAELQDAGGDRRHHQGAGLTFVPIGALSGRCRPGFLSPASTRPRPRRGRTHAELAVEAERSTTTPIGNARLSGSRGVPPACPGLRCARKTQISTWFRRAFAARSSDRVLREPLDMWFGAFAVYGGPALAEALPKKHRATHRIGVDMKAGTRDPVRSARRTSRTRRSSAPPMSWSGDDDEHLWLGPPHVRGADVLRSRPDVRSREHGGGHRGR